MKIKTITDRGRNCYKTIAIKLFIVRSFQTRIAKNYDQTTNHCSHTLISLHTLHTSVSTMHLVKAPQLLQFRFTLRINEFLNRPMK